MRIHIRFISYVILFAANLLNAQNDTTSLKILEIKEIDDKVVEIRALKKAGSTIRILSIKKAIQEDSCQYEKMQIGVEYKFELEPGPVYMDNLTFRVGKKIYWKTGDDPKEMPHFSTNTKGIYIKKE